MRRFHGLTAVAAVALTAACHGNQAMTDAQRSQVAGEIRAAVDSVTAGFNRLDLSTYIDQLSQVQTYAEDGMVYPSADSVASVLRAIQASARSADLSWIGEPVVVVLTPRIGVFTGLFHYTSTDAAGANATADGAWSAVYQRIGGAWKIVVAHESHVPAGATQGT